MNYSIFKKYDIRGIFEKDFNLKDVDLIASGILTFFLNKDPSLKRIAICQDSRESSFEIKKAFINVVKSFGIKVLDLGVAPTPVFTFFLEEKNIFSGVMITASHNPWKYNGFKIVFNSEPISGGQIEEIKNIVLKKAFFEFKASPLKGSCNFKDPIKTYVSYLKKEFLELVGLKKELVFDSLNASTEPLVKRLSEEMGWNFKTVKRCSGDAGKIESPDPTNIKNLSATRAVLRESNSEFAICFDGDGDRVSVVDKSLGLIPGDKLLAFFAKYLKIKKVVAEVKCSNMLEDLGREVGFDVLRSPTGSVSVSNLMASSGADLAGELSGHYFFKNLKSKCFGDGIFAALEFLRILQRSKKPLKELFLSLPKKFTSDESRIKINSLSEAKKIIGAVKTRFKGEGEILEIDGIKVTFKDSSWALVRSSNTEPCISARFEAKTENRLKELKESVFNILGVRF